MTTTERPTLPTEAEPYVAAVRALLWSLPAEERDELLDDLSAHLGELAAEEGPGLRERLGAPSTYATDFVTSAGVTVEDAKDATRRVRDALHLPPAVRARLESFRPAWLVLRPFVIVFGGAAYLNDHMFGDIGGGEIVALGVLAVALIGPSQRLSGGWDRAATIVGVIGALLVIGAVSSGRQYIYVDNTGYGPTGVLSRGDGRPVTNIWAYDAEGNPVDVFLFDQDGRPLDDVGADGYDERTGDQLHSFVRTDGDGRPIPNLYPREQRRVRYDDRGYPSERKDQPPALVTPQLEPETTSTTTSTSTSTTAPTSTTTSAGGQPAP
jgi:hypothetical protein